MKKINLFFSLILIALFVGCTTDEYNSNDDKNSRRRNFKTTEEFCNEYLRLANSLTENSDLIKEKMLKDNSLMSLSPALNEILNDQNEFSINDEIYWYYNGDFYNIGKDQSLKNNPSDLTKSNLIVLSKNENEEEVVNDGNTQNQRFNLNIGGLDARYQKEFYRQSYYNCGSNVNLGPAPRKVKFVHEVYSETIFYAQWQYVHSLYLRVKLEYNHKGNSWKWASEKRNFNINITDNSYLVSSNNVMASSAVPTSFGNPAGFSYGINQTFTCSNDQTILLRQFSTFGQSFVKWSVSIDGTITHRINGDAWSNEWTNYVSM